jgi:pheromone shutdown protein TraB
MSGMHTSLTRSSAGHRKGIEGYLLDPASLPPMADLTTKAKSYPWGKIIGIVMILMFAFILITIIFSGVGFNVLLWALLYWVILHGVLTAVFTLAAGGHPLSALTGFLISGYTAVNPLLAAGWFSAIVEAKIRKPSKQDLHKIFEAESFTEMRKNSLFRVVMVAALANVGSTIGTFAYFFLIFPALGIDPGVMIGQGMTNFWHWLTMLI